MGWVAPFKCVVEIASDIRKAGLQENVCFLMMYNSHIFRIQKILNKYIFMYVMDCGMCVQSLKFKDVYF
jgi:hypothetical protein